MTHEGRQAVVLAIANAARGRAKNAAQILEAWRGEGDPVAHWERRVTEAPDDAPSLDAPVEELLTAEALEGLIDLIERQRSVGTSLLTVIDDAYPRCLRAVDGRPPYLWVKGSISALEGERSLAIVGTRQASAAAVERATAMAEQLAAHGVVIYSGLARGIDTAAHVGALDSGGITVAVMGTGTSVIYPRENERLADRIVDAGGALASQFMPDATGRRWTFPMRNAVMSGMTQGTLVVEASETSGAKLQARIGLQQGRPVMLAQQLVASEQWARGYVERRGAVSVATSDDVLRVIDSGEHSFDQLALC